MSKNTNTIIVFLLLTASQISFSQSYNPPYVKGNTFVTIKTGLNLPAGDYGTLGFGTVPGITAGMDYFISDNFTANFLIGYTSWSEKINSDTPEWGYSIIPVYVGMNYFTDLNDLLYLFFGFQLGLSIRTNTWYAYYTGTPVPYYNKESSSGPVLGIKPSAGIGYPVTDNFHINLTLAYDVVYDNESLKIFTRYKNPEKKFYPQRVTGDITFFSIFLGVSLNIDVLTDEE